MLKCDLENHTINYLSFGEGRPIIIMHGRGPNDHQYMKSDLESLFKERTGWRRIYIDLPGHGQTAWPDWVTSPDQILDMLCEFIDQVIPGKRFALAALSWGGHLSLGLVARRKDQVEGLYLSVPVVKMDFLKQNRPEVVTLVESSEFIAALQEDEMWITDVITVQDPAFLDRFCREVFAVARNNARHNPKMDVIEQQLSYDAGKLYFDKPVLILTGRQDNVAGYQDAWDLIENFPRATFAVLDRASHFLSVEQNSLMIALISEWLDRVEEEGISI